MGVSWDIIMRLYTIGTTLEGDKSFNEPPTNLVPGKTWTKSFKEAKFK